MKPQREYYTSPLSAFCAEMLPEDFNFVDGDEVVFHHSAQPTTYARETGRLLILESKHPGEELTRSQRETYPLLAAAVSLAAAANLVRRDSGVYVIEGEPPFADGAAVMRIRAATRPGIDWTAIGAQIEARRKLSHAALCRFIRCRP